MILPIRNTPELIQGRLELQRHIDSLFSYSQHSLRVIESNSNKQVKKPEAEQAKSNHLRIVKNGKPRVKASTEYNAFSYIQDDTIIKKMNDKPNQNHRDFMKFLENDIGSDHQFSIERDTLYFLIRQDDVIYTNIVKSVNADGTVETFLTDKQEQDIADIHFEELVELFKVTLENKVKGVNEIYSFDEMSDEAKKYLSMLFSSKSVKHDTLLSMCKTNNSTIEINKIKIV